MKSSVSIIASTLILGGGIGGYILFGQKPEVAIKQAADANDAIPVVTRSVTPHDEPFHLNVDGEAMTYRVVTVGAEVEGRVIRKTVSARGGTYVQKGELLFEFDPTNYELQIESLNAQLLQATEELNAIAVDLKNAAELVKLSSEDLGLQQKHLERMKALLERRTANDSEVETAMMQELTARNALQTLKNQIRTLEQQQKTRAASQQLVRAQLKRAETDLTRCRVVSPIEGRIVDDLHEEGDYIKSGDPLVHISDGSKMEVKCHLRGEELAWVWQQRDAPRNGLDPITLPRVPCEVTFTFEGVETIWDGYIARLDGTGIDRDMRTFPCFVLVSEPQNTRVNDSAGGRAITPPTLMSGMYVNVRIPVESPMPLLRVPIEAVRPGGQIWISREGKLEILTASLAHVSGDFALVRRDGSGFHEGDRVITSPLTIVRNGMAVMEAEENDE